jgi:glycyl-tRNA synthetase beta chain
MKRDLLFEIGTEEIPAKFMPGALAQLKELAEKNLTAERLTFDSLETLGTPRRLALIVNGLVEQQSDLVEEVKGPAKKAAFDVQGQATKAAEGFARGQGVAVADLFVKDTGAGEYIFASKKVTGRPTKELLPEFLTKLITGLNFPKPMRWADLEFRFARPIRWVVALFGEEVIDWEFIGLKAGRTSLGHRTLAKTTVEFNTPAEYQAKLKAAFVIVDQNERRRNIWEQIKAAATAEGGRVEENEDLLEEVTHIVEYPTALVGSFESKYLELPKEVVITPMREHQRYFPVYDAEGKLLNNFVTVRNGNAEHLDIVRSGNEKVLRARLADANFYYQEDLKTPFDQTIPRLGKIVFHEKLGTILEKVERVRKLGAFISQQLNLSEIATAELDRAIYLAKGDLVTMMVYDFPELQGVMGAHYAEKSGEKPAVAQAIFEHYLPRFAGDQLPDSQIGKVAAIADKLDSIVGAFAIGIQPTGSQDPYALRRQALGVCNIMLDGEYNVPMQDLIAAAYAPFAERVEVKLSLGDVQEQLGEFFQQRVRNILTDHGYRYDLIDAVLVQGANNPVESLLKAKALAIFKESEQFLAYTQAFIRANNLAKKTEVFEVKEELCLELAEQELFKVLQQANIQAAPAIDNGAYSEALEAAVQLVKPIEEFFAKLMVMVEDENLRNNRLALLWQSTKLMGCAGDLSKLVI